jgi:hypothetical protein
MIVKVNTLSDSISAIVAHTSLIKTFPRFSLGNSLLNLLKHFRYALCVYTSSVYLENVSKQGTKNTKATKRSNFYVNFDTVKVTVTRIIVGMFVLKGYSLPK